MFFRKSRNKKDSNAKNSSGYSRVINADNIYYSDTQKSPKNSRVATDYEESYCYAVKNVLSQKGFEAVTVQMSSERCGISITGEYQDSTFYMFFKCHSSSLDVKEVRFSIMDIVRNIETGSYEEDKIQYILRYTFENLGFKNLDLDSKDKISHVIAYKNKTMYSFTFSCPFWIKKESASKSSYPNGNSSQKSSSNHTNASPESSIDQMDGHKFEELCAVVLRKNGFYSVEKTQGSGDQGIDIIAYKGGYTYGIQCKRHKSKIGNKAVQEVFAGKMYYNCDKVAVLTNNFFTKSAISLAKKTGVELWDRRKLLELINIAIKQNK